MQMPVERVDCSLIPEESHYACSKKGTCETQVVSLS